jgi:hypothetical protein
MFQIKSWLKRLCAVSLILLMQGPAMVLQQVAWAGMLVSYTQEKGLARGVVDTFDGNHPCGLCAKAQALRESGKQDDPLNPQQEKKNLRFIWGEMVAAHPPVLLDISGHDCPKPPATAVSPTHGRGKDSPVVPPPERA